MNEPRFASIEQARIITETYQAHRCESKLVLRALSLAASLRKISIRIDPGEIIVGNRTPGIRAGVVFPEAGLSWLEKEIGTLDTRDQDRFQVRPGNAKYFREILVPFWRGKTLEDGIVARMGDEIGRIGKVVKINQKDHAQGHIIPDGRSWLNLGPAGLIARVRERADVADHGQREFLRSVDITLRAARDFMLRYAELAAELRDRLDYHPYAQELGETARICRKLADQPPESFHEAAMYGRDEHGPTAVLKSVGGLNGRLASNGSLLNLKFLPEFFTRVEDRRKLNAFLRSFCRMSINHVQFNVVRREDLLKAQKDPDAYRGLTIRVAGYTAYFTELAGDLQNEIIARTSHGV
jgi:pyruvate-formate lyase